MDTTKTLRFTILRSNEFFPSVEVNCETVSHAGILDSRRRVGGKETNNPEDEREDERANGQHEAAYQAHQVAAHALTGLGLLLLLLLVGRLDSDHVHPFIKTNMTGSGLLEHLVSRVQDHLQEGDCHREQHPDVNHLDVRSDGKALGKSQKTTRI